MNELKPEPQTVALRVTFNGVDHLGVAETDRSLLENIEAMNLPIRSSCWRGLCGSCRVELASGELQPDKHIIDGGYVLSCSSQLASDAHVIVSY
ncbi:2Fe-2S iron-sulfur cluster-binding protein [Chitinimonas lacunae]|uniref:2Fe-2S iron-sulfur cluster-binding protein n=1 Tax=Chitinimonas lacunae TaxID=1963018 RepID=A0ABV8MQI9_9NEIS